MRAMVLEEIAPIATSPLKISQVDDPQPRRGQVRLRVSCCGICRTDLHVIEGDLPTEKLPIIPGHQIVGIVDAQGPGCTRFENGQRVGVAWLRHTCGHCPFCTSERENLCSSQQFTGYHADGGYAEYAVVDERFAYVIPEAFDDVHAAPLLCAGIVGYRSLKRANLPAGGTLAIYGFGSSAHVIAQIAQARGCDVYVVTRGESHRELARNMGAAWVGETADQMPVRTDSAIIFAPAGNLVPEALAHLEKGGTLSLAGIHMTPIPQLEYDKHVFYERDIRSVTANTREDGRELLQEAASIPIRPQANTFPLEKANEALQALKADRLNGTGVVVIDTT